MPTLNFRGKGAVKKLARQTPYRLLQQDERFSCGDHASGNLLVQGDNLEALKALLPYYVGKVKCIYIDPPYNTGNEGWVYNDNVNSKEIKDWLNKVVGKQAEDLNRHDKWLCMMYPRLTLLKQFLREDGVIFISIDDNEQANLKLLLDELFGEKNFVANFIWQHRKPSQNDIDVSLAHNYTFCFAKNRSAFKLNSLQTDSSKFTNPDNDHRGDWVADPFDAPNIRENLSYPITNPNTGDIYYPPKGRCWRFSYEKYQQALLENRILFGKTGRSRPQYKRFLSEAITKGVSVSTIWNDLETATNGTKNLMAIFGGNKIFDTPKPISLIERIIYISTNSDDIILDSFAGSGTTGHAVLAANAEDGGKRKFVLVEMEPNIAQNVTCQRLARVINGYHKNGDESKWITGLDGGFSFCTLDKPLFNQFGNLNCKITFNQLAAHIFFMETGCPLTTNFLTSQQTLQTEHTLLANQEHSTNLQLGQNLDLPTLPPNEQQTLFSVKAPRLTNVFKPPLIGEHNGKAVYVLFAPNSPQMPNAEFNNVLNMQTLNSLHKASSLISKSVIYAEACTLTAEQLAEHNLEFKQIPYSIKAS